MAATLFAGILGIFSLLCRINTIARIVAMTGLTLLGSLRVLYGWMGLVIFGAGAAILVVIGTQITLKNNDFNDLAKMTYGVVCFATLLSFVGTVLGGIWADQSWGRFWGWDPKENGALLIVIWKCPHFTCPLGRQGQGARHRAAGHRGQHRRGLVLLRHQTPRRRPPRLRLQERHQNRAYLLHSDPAALARNRIGPEQILGGRSEFLPAATGEWQRCAAGASAFASKTGIPAATGKSARWISAPQREDDQPMLTAEGCLQAPARLCGKRLDPPPDGDYLLLSDPLHLMYVANFWVDPISLGGGYLGYLMVRKDGHAKLLHDNKLPHSVEEAHVEERRPVPWYDGQSPAHGPRQLAVLENVNPSRSGMRVHDRPGDPYASVVIHTIAQMRRQKALDEIALLRRCMAATDAGHAWARANIKAGMTELDMYSGVSAACIKAAGMPVIVYGDFAVSPGPERRGGGPTQRILKNGDMFILDYSVVIGGYRSDFTNTLVVGGQPNADQKRLYDLCVQANDRRRKGSCVPVPPV